MAHRLAHDWVPDRVSRVGVILGTVGQSRGFGAGPRNPSVLVGGNPLVSAHLSRSGLQRRPRSRRCEPHLGAGPQRPEPPADPRLAHRHSGPRPSVEACAQRETLQPARPPRTGHGAEEPRIGNVDETTGSIHIRHRSLATGLRIHASGRGHTRCPVAHIRCGSHRACAAFTSPDSSRCLSSGSE